MAKRQHNSVHDDAIWRQTIRYQENTANVWEKNWGFMREAMIENVSQINKNRKESIKLPRIKSSQTVIPSKLPPGLASEDSIISDWLCTSNVSKIINYRFPSEKFTMPATTSQEVGWPWLHQEDIEQDPHSVRYKRSSVPQAKTLERFGKYARGQGDVLKWFGAREALP